MDPNVPTPITFSEARLSACCFKARYNSRCFVPEDEDGLVRFSCFVDICCERNAKLAAMLWVKVGAPLVAWRSLLALGDGLAGIVSS